MALPQLTMNIENWDSVASSQRFNAQDLVNFYKIVFTESANHQEGEMVANLVDQIIHCDNKDWLCHVAIDDNTTIVGAVCWTKLLVNGYSAYLMSPVAVASNYQGLGIGQQLIHHGLQYLKSKNIDFVVSYGDPNYYMKVGFKPLNAKKILPPYPLSMPQGWIGQSLTQQPIEQILLNRPPICIKPFCNPLIW